jgi:hypothetical protein
MGALCAVFRAEEWIPLEHEEIRGCQLTGFNYWGKSDGVWQAFFELTEHNTRAISNDSNLVHSECRLVGDTLDGKYRLGIVPTNIRVTARHNGNAELSHSTSMLKCIAAIVQLGFACISIYRARQNQVEHYGNAAFGLTVIPYAIMSFVNLTANIITPDFPMIYMVRSEVMDEAENRGGKFDDVVGVIDPRCDNPETVNYTSPTMWK